ncbi:MAG: LapA family protein [Flavobacteriales bacterium]|jgi:uncharacterized integral membrane protein|nr:LapA family protein [Flavobacteriales bacterium]MBP9159614.1 LapA family protein [Flavobacteriales bacterium]MCI1751541.1 LapA family protein [Flavobacteriales bacterium]
MSFKSVVVLLLAILVTIVCIQNADMVDLKFLVWNFPMSRILLIGITFLLGGAAGYLLARKRKA